MVTNSSTDLNDTGYWKKVTDRGQRFQVSKSSRIPSMSSDEFQRFLIWVDAVGGYLICPREEIKIGQAVPDSDVDIPLLGDLARNHLKLIRTNQGYLLEAFGYVEVNNQAVTDKLLLKNKDLIRLTGGIEFVFSNPHPLSASARIDISSSHRTQPWSDAVVLMAESFVMGPNLRNHVVCRDWEDDLVFFRKNEKLYCKSLSPLSVDNQSVTGKCEIQMDSHILGQDFTMKLEPIST